MEFLGKLTVWRRVTLSDEITIGWLAYLQSIDYSYEQTTKAELWCEFGDWSGQSVDRTLDTQFVFFPTPAQTTEAIVNARQSGLVVMTAEGASKALEMARQEVYTLEREKRRHVDAGGQIRVSEGVVTKEQVAEYQKAWRKRYGN